MKKPIFDQDDRIFMRIPEASTYGAGCNLRLNWLKLLREFERVYSKLFR